MTDFGDSMMSCFLRGPFYSGLPECPMCKVLSEDTPAVRVASTIDIATIYARIPSIACRGLCHGSCGPVPATRAEIATIEAQSSHAWGVTRDFTCTMLAGGRCSVYESRPLLCRLWGVVEKMACPHGCIPDRWLSDDEAKALLDSAGKIGGGYDLRIP